MADHGARQIFSITIYDTQEDLDNAMRESGSEFRFASLAELGCTALDARAFEVVAGAVNPDAFEVDFAKIIPPINN